MNDRVKDFEYLCDRFGTTKCLQHGYHRYYEDILINPRLTKGMFLLVEVGYGCGASLKVWKMMFPSAKIAIFDIQAINDDSIDFFIKGDQTHVDDLRSLQILCMHSKMLARIIVDDGSHHPIHQINTFNEWFSCFLEPGGVYFIEDIEFSYYQENSIRKFHIVTLFSKIVHYFVNNEFLYDDCVEPCENISAAIFPLRTDTCKWISSVSFGTNCIVIKKKTVEERIKYERKYRWKCQQNAIIERERQRESCQDVVIVPN